MFLYSAILGETSNFWDDQVKLLSAIKSNLFGFQFQNTIKMYSALNWGSLIIFVGNHVGLEQCMLLK